MKEKKSKVADKIKTHSACSGTPTSPPKKRAVCAIMWKNMIEPGGPQTIEYGACAEHSE
jgi:hypothetical protein